MWKQNEYDIQAIMYPISYTYRRMENKTQFSMIYMNQHTDYDATTPDTRGLRCVDIFKYIFHFNINHVPFFPSLSQLFNGF